MADPAAKPGTKASEVAKPADPTSPDGKVTNLPNGEGTRQTEPRPEDYPAKVASPSAQINTATEQTVGEPPALVTGDDEVDKGIEEGIAARREAVEKTDERFAEQAKEDGTL
jgi:hypothetical protein